MQPEIESRFSVSPDTVQTTLECLKFLGAVFTSHYLQDRSVSDVVSPTEKKFGRLRQSGSKTTLAVKTIRDNRNKDQMGLLIES